MLWPLRPKSIKLPDDERIAFSQMGQRVRKTGSFGGCAARFIGKNPLAARFIERVALQR
jgi:hypothetical protein